MSAIKNNISRKSFIQQLSLAGSGLTLGFYYISCGKNKEKVKLVNIGVDDYTEDMELNPFVHIGKDGKVTIYNHKPDMGQGTFQSMPLLVAEELDVDLKDVVVKQAPANAKYGNMLSGGSASVRTNFIPLRKSGAAAREMLVLAAATKWGVTPDKCKTEKGKVINIDNNKSLSYGELVEGTKGMKIPEEPKLKEMKDFQYLGKSVPRKDIEWKVRGEAIFGIDLKRENMVYACVVHSPNFGGKIKSIDDSKTLAVKGVIQTMRTQRLMFKHKNDSVAVIADNYWSALKGSKELKVEWEEVDNSLSNEKIKELMRKGSKEKGLNFYKTEGLKEKKYEITSEYETPFMSHAQLEPQNSLVVVEGDKCEVWAPVQSPERCVPIIAEFLGIPKENVQVHVPFLGGGFGRRAFLCDYIIEGCIISKELKRPVKILWSREADLTQGPYRPGSLNILKANLNSKTGEVTDLYHKVMAPNIGFSLWGMPIDTNSARSAMEPIKDPYYITKNYESYFVNVDIDPIPVCPWRSVYSSTNIFAHECFIDELAIKSNIDPLDFRLKMLPDSEKKTLEHLRNLAEWDKELPENWGKGVAISKCFQTTAAHVVFVSKKGEKGIKIEKIVSVINCGFAVNPDNVKAQVEGCVAMALSASIKGEIIFENGKVVNTNFDKYELPRINEIPPLEVHILPSTEDPTGAGEPGLPPLAPALCNAIFNLTKIRIKKLPLDINNIG